MHSRVIMKVLLFEHSNRNFATNSKQNFEFTDVNDLIVKNFSKLRKLPIV